MSESKMYTTTPETVEAWQFLLGEGFGIELWCGGEIQGYQKDWDSATENVLKVPNVKGVLTAFEGDYVLKDEKGRFSVMQKHDFENKYKEKPLKIELGDPARWVGGSGEAYGRSLIPDPSVPRGDSIKPSGWGKNSDCP